MLAGKEYTTKCMRWQTLGNVAGRISIVEAKLVLILSFVHMDRIQRQQTRKLSMFTITRYTVDYQ